MRQKMLYLFCFMLFSMSAKALEIDTTSKISSVTVFPDRAEVVRTSKVSLPKGKRTVVFNELPTDLMIDSLRVSGKGNKSFTIGSVETKTIFTQNLSVEKEKILQDKIQKLQDKESFIRMEIEASDAGKAFLKNMSVKSDVPFEKIEKKDGLSSPDSWKKAWETIRFGMQELGKESLENQLELRKIQQEISALQMEQRQISTHQKSYKQVRVNVESNQATLADLVLSYQIRGASWTPLYDVRLDSVAKDVTIVQYGNISQRTGEDWKNVDLTLSTARTFARMTPPFINPIYLNIITPRPMPKSKGMVFSDTISATAPRMMKSVSNFAMPKEVAMDMSVKAGYGAVNVQGTEFSGQYVIKGKSNVPADGADYRFNIADYNTQSEIRAEVYPAFDSSAYVIATFVYKAKVPLLAGKSALFRDGAFIGESYFDFLRPNEKLHLPFGQDEKIRVKYTNLGEKSSTGGVLVKEEVKEFTSITEIQNLHQDAMKIAVFERLPISQNDEVKVRIVSDKTTKGFIENAKDKNGQVKWKSVYKPQEKRKIDYMYEVSYPQEKRLTGL